HGLLAAGCNSIPAAGDGKPAPAPALIGKGGPPAGEPIRANTVLYWTVVTPNTVPNQNSGWSQVAPDGTVEVGAFGTVKVEGLTIPQAVSAMEHQFGQRGFRDTRVKLSAGAVQPVQYNPAQKEMTPWQGDTTPHQVNAAPAQAAPAQSPSPTLLPYNYQEK